jgi:hypothetical protein
MQPGCEEEVIRCDLIKVSLHEITPSEDDPYALQNIPNTAPWLISHGRYAEALEAFNSFVPGSRTTESEGKRRKLPPEPQPLSYEALSY